jgi:hypothetical protein
MINLKLAEYDLKTGKFQGFLELAEEPFYEGFLLGKDFIMVMDEEAESHWERINNIFYQDEKDPLNRFNGLFDGRTYGKGKFILLRGLGEEKAFEDDIIFFDDGIDHHQNLELKLVKWQDKEFGFNISNIGNYCELCDDIPLRFGLQIKGNLHQNPELYEKIK